MPPLQARVSVKGILPVPNEPAVWLVHYGGEDRFGLPGGQVSPEDDGNLGATLEREVREEMSAILAIGSLSIVDAWMSLNEPKVDGDNRLVVVYAANLLQPPSGDPSPKGERGVRVSLSQLGEVDLAPEYRAAVKKHMGSLGWWADLDKLWL